MIPRNLKRLSCLVALKWRESIYPRECGLPLNPFLPGMWIPFYKGGNPHSLGPHFIRVYKTRMAISHMFLLKRS